MKNGFRSTIAIRSVTLRLPIQNCINVISTIVIAKLTSVGTVDFLVSERMSGFFGWSHRFNTLQPKTSHWTFWYIRSFLQILKYQFATGRSNNLSPIGFCIIRQSSSVRYSLNHFEVTFLKLNGKILGVNGLLQDKLLTK